MSLETFFNRIKSGEYDLKLEQHRNEQTYIKLKYKYGLDKIST